MTGRTGLVIRVDLSKRIKLECLWDGFTSRHHRSRMGEGSHECRGGRHGCHDQSRSRRRGHGNGRVRVSEDGSTSDRGSRTSDQCLSRDRVLELNQDLEGWSSSKQFDLIDRSVDFEDFSQSLDMGEVSRVLRVSLCLRHLGW